MRASGFELMMLCVCAHHETYTHHEPNSIHASAARAARSGVKRIYIGAPPQLLDGAVCPRRSVPSAVSSGIRKETTSTSQ